MFYIVRVLASSTSSYLASLHIDQLDVNERTEYDEIKIKNISTKSKIKQATRLTEELPRHRLRFEYSISKRKVTMHMARSFHKVVDTIYTKVGRSKAL